MAEGQEVMMQDDVGYALWLSMSARGLRQVHQTRQRGTESRHDQSQVPPILPQILNHRKRNYKNMSYLWD